MSNSKNNNIAIIVLGELIEELESKHEEDAGSHHEEHRDSLYTARSLICGSMGHAWIDMSYGGPESGAIDSTCSRCQKEVHHQLY